MAIRDIESKLSEVASFEDMPVEQTDTNLTLSYSEEKC